MDNDAQLPLWAHALLAIPGISIFVVAFVFVRREVESTRRALGIIAAWWAGILAILGILLFAFGALNDLIETNPVAGEKLGGGAFVFLSAVGVFVYGLTKDKEKARLGKRPDEAYDPRFPINNLADWGSGMGLMGMVVGSVLIVTGIAAL